MSQPDRRTPPQNLDAEASVLGSVLLDNDAAHDIMDVLRPDDFYRDVHRKIFQAILDLLDRGEPADLVTLTNALKERDLLEKFGGAAYLATLVDAVPTSANVMYYARIVKDKAILRDIISAGTDLVALGHDEDIDNVSECLDMAEKRVFQVSEGRQSQSLAPIAEVVKESFAQIEKNYERKELITGLASGYREIDKITGGFQDSDLVIVAARPAMGKTSFCLNVANHIAVELGVPVAIFSLEMAREQLVMRLLCSEARIDSLRMRAGLVDEDEWLRLTDAAGRLSDSPVYIDDTPQVNIFDMRAKARRLKASKGLGMIVVDYLQLMGSKGRTESREREISEISRSLKGLAKELNIPIIALSQLNRGVESRQDKRPQLADLRESGAIEQDADMVGFIYRDEVYHPDTPDAGVAEFIVVKHRNGPIGTARLAFLSQYTKFENLAYDPES